jgi:hypothetical protein
VTVTGGGLAILKRETAQGAANAWADKPVRMEDGGSARSTSNFASDVGTALVQTLLFGTQ